MAGSRCQAYLPRRGTAALLVSVLQIALLSAGLIVPLSVISAGTGVPVASEDHEEGISTCVLKRSRVRCLVADPPPAVVPYERAVRRGSTDTEAYLQLRIFAGHRLSNGLLAPLRC